MDIRKILEKHINHEELEDEILDGVLSEKGAIVVGKDPTLYSVRKAIRKLRNMEFDLQLKSTEKVAFAEHGELRDLILDSVNESLEIDDCTVKYRGRFHVWGRFHAMVLLKEYTPYSLTQIGRLLGGKDHSTVIHGLKQHYNFLDTNDKEYVEYWEKTKEVFMHKKLELDDKKRVKNSKNNE